MGQKVNPHGFRVGVIKDWDSRWFTKDENFGDTLVSDYKIREFLKNKYRESGVPKIEIERDNNRVRVFLHCAKPGIIIGRNGSEIDKLRAELEAMLGTSVSVNVIEVKNIDTDAQLVAENIAGQLERRISFRRAMKQSIGRTMRLGVKGIKIMVSGRLGGAEIARSEQYHEGTIPLQTLRADIDYGFAEANTTYGKIGVKVWIYKGEVLSEVSRTGERRDNRRSKKPGERRERRSGDRREGGRREGGRREGGRGGRDEGRNINAGARQTRPGYKKPAPKAAPAPDAAPEQTTEGGAD